jgi:hypothetical protein
MDLTVLCRRCHDLFHNPVGRSASRRGGVGNGA